VNRFTKMISAVALGFALIGNASAAFDKSSDPGYLGYIGNVESGRYGGVEDIGTDYIWNSSTPGWDENLNDTLGPPIAVPHWYKFTLDNTMVLSDFLELGGDVASLTISFFDSNGASPIGPITSNAPHGYELVGTFWADSSWWMKVEGTLTSTGVLDNYTVQLIASPVPLPPAILLFASAIAGFVVMGLKRKQRQVI